MERFLPLDLCNIVQEYRGYEMPVRKTVWLLGHKVGVVDNDIYTDWMGLCCNGVRTTWQPPLRVTHVEKINAHYIWIQTTEQCYVWKPYSSEPNFVATIKQGAVHEESLYIIWKEGTGNDWNLYAVQELGKMVYYFASEVASDVMELKRIGESLMIRYRDLTCSIFESRQRYVCRFLFDWEGVVYLIQSHTLEDTNGVVLLRNDHEFIHVDARKHVIWLWCANDVIVLFDVEKRECKRMSHGSTYTRDYRIRNGFIDIF